MLFRSDVRIADAAGNTGPSTSRTWTIDTAAPGATSITSQPSALDTDTTPTFAFTGAATGESFQCRIDSGAWGACTSAWTSAALADGQHVFQVRLVDLAGNTGAVQTASWTLDTTPPAGVPAITSGPSGTVASATGSFAFAGAASGETYACKLDAAAWAACTSPQATGSLADGSHTFQVALRDAAGNQGTATTRTWTIDTTPPATQPTITSQPANPSGLATPQFAFGGAASGETYECQIDGGTWSACTSPYTAATLAEIGRAHV